MRVTDLAKKVNMATSQLREKLPQFGVSEDAKEVDAATAKKITDELLKKAEAPNSDGPALMGLMFDDGPAEPPAAEEEAPKKEEEAAPEPEEKPAAEAGPLSGNRRVFSDGFVMPERPKASSQAGEARARWAAAKKASEKIIEDKKRKAARDQKKAIKAMDVKKAAEMAAKPVEIVIDRSKPKRIIKCGASVSVRQFSQSVGVSPIRVVAELLKNGVMTTVNGSIDFDTAVIIAEPFWVEVERDTAAVKSEDLLKGDIDTLIADEPELLQSRAPVVAVMGHVDHGKTTLLDAIRKSNVASSEAGGITQHIGAYQAKVEGGRLVTFLDTPGHEAFTAMRARGAKATDIAVLVVAADDGMKPQSIEALNHARDAGVPIVVALTKMDVDGANPDRVKGELAEHDLTPISWGGKTEVVEVSAQKGEGISNLLDVILLTSDVQPPKANPNREAVGTIIESHLDTSLGPVATVLINTGTLKVGDPFIIGPVTGKVKRMMASDGSLLKEAGPAVPVQVAGLSGLPERGVGEILQAFTNISAARKKAEEFKMLIAERDRNKVASVSQLISRIKKEEAGELRLVIKADFEGSLEAVRESCGHISGERTVRVVHGGIGEVTETDILMAASGDGLIVAFHVGASSRIEDLARKEEVTIRRHTIIYKLLEELQVMLEGDAKTETIETEIGTLEIRGVFFSKRKEQVVGGLVKDGRMEQNAQFRVMRAGEEIGSGAITSIQREEKKVTEVKDGFECGLKVQMNEGSRIEIGDELVAWKHEEVAVDEKKAA